MTRHSRKPKDPGQLVTVAEVAKLHGVSPREIRDWIKEGAPTADEAGTRGIRFWYADLFRWLMWRQYTKARPLEGKLAPAQSPTQLYANVSPMESVRLENIRADTMLKEVRLEQLRGEVARIDIIEHCLSRVGGQICAIFETIPGKIKRRNPNLTATDLEIVKRELAKALNVAATIEPDLDGIEFEPVSERAI